MPQLFKKEALHQEFDRQVQNLLDKEYPKLAGISEQAFLAKVMPLKESLHEITITKDNNFPFVIVIKQELVSPVHAMETVVAKKQHGMTQMYPKQPADFKNISEIEVPESVAYLAYDIDTGQEFLNISPEESLKSINKQSRTPLTLDEGVSLVVQFPEILTDRSRYNCIQMPGSRIQGDERVPSIWISYNKPRLGWCWDRNIHTWLGSASAKSRAV